MFKFKTWYTPDSTQSPSSKSYADWLWEVSALADGTYKWIVWLWYAWETLAFWDLVYFDPWLSAWKLANASAALWATWDARWILWICVQAASPAWATKILMYGVVRSDASFPSLTVNRQVYVSSTSWDITNTQPSTTDAVIRVVWFAMMSTMLFFNPSSDYITHA